MSRNKLYPHPEERAKRASRRMAAGSEPGDLIVRDGAARLLTMRGGVCCYSAAIAFARSGMPNSSQTCSSASAR